MKKYLLALSIVFGLFTVTTVQAQSAKEVLDKCAAKVSARDGVKADFSMTSAQYGDASGKIAVKGKMFHATTPMATMWFDGKTLWTYRKSTNEVNITTPTAAEKQSINPYHFINIYKKGYSYTMRETTLRGKGAYEVTLNATSPANKLRKMVITIDKATYHPLAVTMQRPKSSTTIYITSCKTKQKFNASTFSFKRSDYPSAEIIDLR